MGVDSYFWYLTTIAPATVPVLVVLGLVWLCQDWQEAWRQDPTRFVRKPTLARFIATHLFLLTLFCVVHPMMVWMRLFLLFMFNPAFIVLALFGNRSALKTMVDFTTIPRDAEQIRDMPSTAVAEYRHYNRRPTPHWVWERQRRHEGDLIMEQLLIYDAFERLSIWTSKLAGATALLVGLLLAPFGLFVPKASAKTGGDRAHATGTMGEQAQAGLYPRLKLAGVVMTYTDVLLPTGDLSAATYGAGVRKAQLGLTGEVNGRLSATAVLAMMSIARAADPVFMAYLQWQPIDSLTITGGRILSPVGIGRNPPPHGMIPLGYPDHGITSSLNDHGFMVRWGATDWLGVNIGALTGEGVASTPDASPDAVFELLFLLADELTLGVHGQSGKQEEGWRHSVATHLVYQTPGFISQSEVLATWDSGQEKPAISWWHLDALHVAPWVQVYLRIEGRHPTDQSIDWRDTKLLGGVNFFPWTTVQLRAALGLPIQEDPTISLRFAAQATF